MTQPKVFTGRRKESVARVRIFDGKNSLMINGKKGDEYVNRADHQDSINEVLRVANLDGKIGIIAKVDGGGITGQKDALRHALARAIAAKYPELRPVLKEKGYLTRDPREKERRKYGLAKARKAYQFSKR